MPSTPSGAAQSIEDTELHEALADLESRVKALEEKPHVDAEYISFEGDADGTGVGFDLVHKLNRVPVGAILIGVGVLADGLSQPNDVNMTMNIPRSDAKTVRLVLRRMVSAGVTTRTWHVLLF